jgi:metallo-beta-lactamase family protein
MTTIQFLGGAGGVTGSKYLVSHKNVKVLVDCGLFQGPRSEREKNWDKFPFNPSEIDAVLLTHAHIDHSGLLPRLYAEGLRAPVYSSNATNALCEILLPDSAMLQEEEAQFRSKKGRSRHSPPKPLYTLEDAKGALTLFKPLSIHKSHELLPDISVSFNHMGHILGACSINLKIEDKTISFSGDIGRYGVPILRDPEPIEIGDLLLVESTYGDRDHMETDVLSLLSKLAYDAFKRGGTLLVPSFAVGRTQLLLYYVRELQKEGRFPDMPIIVDSPRASDATSIYERFPEFYDSETHSKEAFHPKNLYFVQSSDESRKLNEIDKPMMLISASGMLSGGRILHHLYHRIGDPRTILLFVGHQPKGGRGEWIQNGATHLTIFKEEKPIRARIETISSLSAHGDRGEIIRWINSCSGSPSKVAVVHGEEDVAQKFALQLNKELNLKAKAPRYTETWEV